MYYWPSVTFHLEDNMPHQFTKEDVETQVRDYVKELKQEFQPGKDRDACTARRDDVIDRIDSDVDSSLWGHFCTAGLIHLWNLDTLVQNMADGSLASILGLAQDEKCVETDSGLFSDDKNPFAVVPGVAFYSLRNLVFHYLSEEGVDMNDDYPFQPTWWDTVLGYNRATIVQALNDASIECRDDEDTEDLRTALIENILDETIDPDLIEEVEEE